jgi:hypothetical protein
VPGLALDFLSDDDKKVRDALAQILRQGDVMKIGDGNAVEASRFDNSSNIFNAIMAAKVDVEIEFHRV